MAEDIQNQPIMDEMSDRRSDLRVKFEAPIEVEYSSDLNQLEQGKAQASHLSSRGLSLLLDKSLPLNSEIILRIPLPDSKYPIQPTARITWTTPNGQGILHGVEFTHIPKMHLPYLNDFLRRKLACRRSIQERRFQAKIVSELIMFRNRKGKKIVGFFDRLIETDINAPFLVIPAPYGETKINSLHIAYYLATNGFNVIRFDPTDHVGESEGDHLEYTMPKLKDDIISTVDYVAKKSPKAKVGIVAASLAARAAFKAVTEDSRVSVLISLVGVVNTQYTLHRVQNEDLVGTYLSGKKWGITNVIGHDVRLHQFLVECVEKKLHNLETTLEDLPNSKCPIVFLCGENDPWIDLNDSKKAIGSMPSDRREVHFISSMHRLKENPSEAKRAFRLIVSAASKYLFEADMPPEKVAEPRAREIGVQGRVEKERSKHLSEFTKDQENDFWKGYLSRFHYIYSFPDYRDLLDTILLELGPVKNDDWVLDAGCGNGNFGLWLLMKLGEEFENSGGLKKLVFNYVGGDIVQAALDHSRVLHSEAQSSLKKKLSIPRNFMIPQYQSMDMSRPLSFLDNTFDKISSNLVISYIANPAFALKELIRVLKPGGKLVLTTLKKDADVSQVYRNFVEHASSEEEVEEARSLLSNAGQILLKETEGYFRFYNEQELHTLLNQAQPGCHATYRRCFADQAIAITISK